MSKFDLFGPKPVPRARASLPTVAFDATRRHFETLMVLIIMGVLIIPVLYYPGLTIIVIFAEVYLIDAIYARIYGAQMNLSFPLERGKAARKSTRGMFDDISVVRATGFALLNR